MKVFVTGGCGFLGSHVCEYYVNLGAKVICYDLMSKHELLRNPYSAESARNYNLNFLKSLGVNCIKGDIRNLEALSDYATGCDYIIHTAAQPTITIGLEDPELDFSSNVIGTYNVLTLARKLHVPVASCATIHVYSNNLNANLVAGEKRYQSQPPAFDESLPTMDGNITPLHASKMTGDIYTRMFIDSYQLEAASFRLSGIYGTRQFGGEDHGWVANFAIRTFMQLPLKIFHNGKQLRDIVYATDVARAFHAFYQHRVPGVYNIGGGLGNTLSLLECIDLLQNRFAREVSVDFAGERFGDLYYFVCDISKAEKYLKWTPAISPENGIDKLVAWIQDNDDLFTNNETITPTNSMDAG